MRQGLALVPYVALELCFRYLSRQVRFLILGLHFEQSANSFEPLSPVP